MDTIFLDKFNCYVANIRNYRWLTKFRYHMKKNTSKIGLDRWLANNSALLYSDFVIYWSVYQFSELKMLNDFMLELKQAKNLDYGRIVFDLVKLDTFIQLPEEPNIVYGSVEGISNHFAAGSVCRINFVELNIDEYEEIKDFLIRLAKKCGDNISYLITKTKNPQTDNTILMVIINENIMIYGD